MGPVWCPATFLRTSAHTVSTHAWLPLPPRQFESTLYLFIEHPFDVGDNVALNGDVYRVKKISLLYTGGLQVVGFQTKG